MKIKLLLTILSISLLFNTLNAGTRWSETGHRTVGKIASQYLTPKAKRELKKLSRTD